MDAKLAIGQGQLMEAWGETERKHSTPVRVARTAPFGFSTPVGQCRLVQEQKENGAQDGAGITRST